MALFNLGGKKKEDLGGFQPAMGIPTPPPGMMQSQPPMDQGFGGLPIPQVNNLRQQGLSDNQIVQALQRDGYNSQQIFDAMNQAGMPNAGPLPPEDIGIQPMPTQEMPQMRPQMPQQQMGGMDLGDRERIEEMAEAIIDEKWEELIKNINKIFEWKEKTEERLAKFDQQVLDLKTNFENLHKAIIGKISEYDENILNVGTEIKAMEKVFQKVLPTFTENVSELSRITKQIRPKK